MKISKLDAVRVKEGKAALFVPSESFTDPHHCEVFFNPSMEFSRSLSSAAFCALTAGQKERPKVLDGLCSTGARGIRYYLERKGGCEVDFCDANPLAIAYAKKNAALNKLKGAHFYAQDFHARAASRRDYDFVELDPFGTPCIFLDSAVRACARQAVLSVTATDLANLCGARPKPCIREYDAVPARGYFCHETALRILIGRVVRTCALHASAFTPKISYYLGHHIKTIGTVERSALAADEALKQIGWLGFCAKCRAFHKTECKKCPECGERLESAGPLWLSKLGDEETLAATAKNAEKMKNEKVAQFARTLLAENGFDCGYADVHEECGAAKKPVLHKIDDILARLRKKGFKAERTHFSPTGIKTDAPSSAVLQAASGK